MDAFSLALLVAPSTASLPLFSIIKSPLLILFSGFHNRVMENGDVHQRRSMPSGELDKMSELASNLPEAVGLLSNNSEDVMGKARRPPKLLNFSQIPEWHQDNYFITGGYRPVSNSYAKSFASWGYLHNEVVNIYTHGLGAVFYPLLGFGLYFALKDRYATSSVGDVLACGCFFLGALLCLGMSATFHTIMNHSPKINKFGNALDYLGIVCLIAGSFVPNIYYGYYCDPNLQIAYWGMVSNYLSTLRTLYIKFNKYTN
jgi:Haemolysin-III related